MRILLSTPTYPPDLGGVAVTSRTLAGHLLGAGYEVHVVVPTGVFGAANEIRRFEEGGACIHRLFHDPTTNPGGSLALHRLVRQLDREIGFDLFHGLFLTAAYPCVTAATRNGRTRPVVASIQGGDVPDLLDLPHCKGPILEILRKATWVTSVNREYLERVSRRFVDLRGRSSVIRSAVSLPGSAQGTWALSDANRGVVGTVGEFRRVKDIPLLVRAYAAVGATLRRRLLLAGHFDGERSEEEWSRTLAGELGVAGELVLTGRFPHDEVVGHLRALHVYVQSSAEEGLSHSLLEAACLGLPIVATAAGGTTEVIVDGENGLVVSHGDPAGLSAAISRVLADENLAMRLSAGARRLAAELSPARQALEWITLYRRILGESP